MGLFYDCMNRYNQRINRHRSARIEDWICDDGVLGNIAVFGGGSYKRAEIAEQGIANAYGRKGIVVIHNNEYLEEYMNHFPLRNCQVYTQFSDTPVCIVNKDNLVYEPLYGMEPNYVIASIYPEISRESPVYAQQHLCCEALRKYIDILEYNQLPTDLDYLLDLCELKLEELESKELSKLPSWAADDILSALSINHIALQVKADLKHYASQLEGRIWSRSHEATSVSIMEAVRNKAFISLRIPSSNPTILDCLATELNEVMDEGSEFLLILDSLNIGNSMLKNIVTNPNCKWLLSGSSIQEIFVQARDEGEIILQKADKIILCQLANAWMAKQYSEMIGTYLRKFISISKNRTWGALELFPGHEKGKSISEQDSSRISPEDLAQLGEGAVLIDQVYGTVEMVKKLIRE